MRMGSAVPMDVDVRVDLPVVRVFMDVNMVPERTAQAPDADSKKDNSNDAFGPGGNCFERERFTQRQREQSDE